LDVNVADPGVSLFVGTSMMPVYAINLGAARLFVNSPFLVLNNLEFVMIYVFSI
jgi:hypothetical protein